MQNISLISNLFIHIINIDFNGQCLNSRVILNIIKCKNIENECKNFIF